MKRNIANRKKYKLGSSQYKQKHVSNELISAVEKLQDFLQTEVNKEFGRNAPKISFAYATKYLYHNYLKGKRY